MEHIVQFAIGIDDEGIKKAVTEKAEKTIIETLKNDVQMHIFNKDYLGRPDLRTLQYWVEKKVEKILDDNKEAIIDAAAERLAEKLLRTKAVKEKVNEVLKGENPNA